MVIAFPNTALSRIAWCCVFLLSNLYGSLVQAKDNALATSYQQAKTALLKGENARYQTTAQALPLSLQHHLQFINFSRRLEDKKTQFKDIDTSELYVFFEKAEHYAFMPTLRKQWLSFVAQQQQWDALLIPPSLAQDVTLICLQRQQQLSQKQEQITLADFKSIWLTGKSLPSSCNPLIEKARDTGLLDDALVIARLKLALKTNQITVARALLAQLPPAQQIGWQAWISVLDNPAIIANDVSPATHELQAWRLFGLSRYAKKDSVAAQALLDQWLKQKKVTLKQSRELQVQLAIYQAGRNTPDALARIVAIPKQYHTDDLRIWGALLNLKQHRYQEALTWLKSLSPPIAAQTQWRYWQGYALNALGKTEAAAEHWRAIAPQIDFYGFLAADELALPYSALKKQTDYPIPTVTTDTSEHLQHALLLQQVGEFNWAKREWAAGLKRATHTQKQAASLLAAQNDWYDFSLKAAASAEGLFKLRYPLAYVDHIDSAIAQTPLSSAVILGLMRQESLFQADVVSPANARGLMQLLPETADLMAKRLSETRGDLNQPANNIRYGTHYLVVLNNQFGLFWPYLLAAYNAGPRKVEQWMPETALASALWIESIPYKETRHYVKRVLENAVIYSFIMGHNPQRLTDFLSPSDTF